MLSNQLMYRNQDVTLDVITKIEHVVRIIAEQQNIPFDDAYRSFIATRTYEALQNTESLMWAESAEYIVDRYFEEFAKGGPDLESHADAGVARFEVFQDKGGKFHFRLKARNGQVVAFGESYETKSAAIKACGIVQRAATGARVLDEAHLSA